MKKIDKVKFTVLIMILSFTVLMFFTHREELRGISVHSLVELIGQKGIISVVLFLAVFALKPFLLIIPSAMISIVGGILFGPIKGLALSVIGFFLSGTLAYWLSRLLGRSFVEKILGKKTLELDTNLEKKGFKILLLLRLPPVLPYDPLSYTCGLTKIKYWDFILASVIGILPETTCYSFLGKNIFDPFSPQFIIPLIFIAAAALSSSVLFTRSRKITREENS
ncbi:TVP38/TMEM64 family protein [Clostridium polynesiense]|uniref:TVP38/TMEM64 family protein n=1 Tax=Clostridium polynesiense TaxID=1325933 RepID=UPI00058DD456|nr:TVP38/TMEM64 family protein [Clostridium polynesiense]